MIFHFVFFKSMRHPKWLLRFENCILYFCARIGYINIWDSSHKATCSGDFRWRINVDKIMLYFGHYLGILYILLNRDNAYIFNVSSDKWPQFKEHFLTSVLHWRIINLWSSVINVLTGIVYILPALQYVYLRACDHLWKHIFI